MEKLNIAEILKDCPKGMELDCTMFENVKFNYIKEDSTFPIKCFIENENSTVAFNEYGEFNKHPNAKCVIFPKGKTTWDGFQRPFKDGDVLIKDNNALCIYKSIHKTYKNKSFIDFYCGYRPSDNQLVIKDTYDSHFGFISEAKLATEEEKQKLFDAIKANGYKWNPETKTLDKLKVSKFDISTLMPFDKVLTRDCNGDKWNINFFSYYRDNGTYQCMTFTKNQCIPYEGNEHLLDTTNDCDEYFKTWE